MKGNLIYQKALKAAQAKGRKWNEVYVLLEKAYSAGNPKAAYAIANWHLHGRYLKKDYKKAVEYLKFACEHHLPDAFFDLAICYESGKGIAKNKKQAFLNYVSAAALGDEAAVQEVGRCYYHGIGVRKNLEIADRWLSAAEALKKNKREELAVMGNKLRRK